MANKAIIIGLDGATFDLILPWIKEGHLPTLKRLIANGASAPLKTILPFTTPAAWTSLASGMGPGKHGVVNFLKSTKDSYEPRTYSRFDVKSKRIWDYLSKNGLNSIVINYPVTYPPGIDKGIMVSGMFSPDSQNIIYPDNLKSLIPDHYQVELEWPLYIEKKESFLEDVKKMIDHRLQLTLELKKRPWDLLACVFIASDRANHMIWGDEGLLEVYQSLDSAVAEIIKGEDCNVFIVSDHGARKAKQRFYINDWLIENSFTKLHSSYKKASRKLIPSREFFHKVFFSHPLLKKIRDAIPSKIRKKVPRQTLMEIDWPSTQAYALVKGAININLKGRERHGAVAPEDYEAVRDKIVNQLSDLTNKDTGRPLIKKVMKREEVYQGQFVKDAPDILLYSDEVDLLSRFINTPGKKTANKSIHDIYGTFIACGPDIKSGQRFEEFSILDVAPTILHLFGLPVNADIDGQVLKEIFKEESSTATREVKYDQDEGGGLKGLEQKVKSKEEEEKIKDRLRGLGYLE